MKKNPLLKFTIAAFALFEVALATSSHAIVPVSWNASVDNTWENALNWTPALEPTNNTFDVEIGLLSSSPFNLSSGFQIDSLTLSNNAANLNLVPGALLAFTSDVTNNGTIVVNTTDPMNSTSSLRFDTNSVISGTGSIQLNGIGYNRANISTANLLTNGANHLIHGRGDIYETSGMFVNNGTVNADAATGDPLLIYLSNNSNQNNNLMEATNGGLLSFQGGILDQTGGGTLLGDGSGSI